MAFQAMTIAGSDSGGGAGIQADLKTFSALGIYGTSVITAITAQNTKTVSAVAPVEPAVIEAQIEAVLEDLDIRAIKIGMLGDVPTIKAVADGIRDCGLPIVLDPVMISKSGIALLAEDARAYLCQELLPMAALLTPNLPEAAALLDRAEATNTDEMAEQGRALLKLGPKAVLMKGGHGNEETCVDLLITPDDISYLSAPRQYTRNTHGTGCTLSAAIAAGLAAGLSLISASRQAHLYLQEAIRQADKLAVGHGHGPVHHFHAVWSNA